MTSLRLFLSKLIAYSTSPHALRSALKTHLSDAEDLVCVLEVLESWMVKWAEKSATFLWDVDGKQAQAPVDKMGYRGKELPPYELVRDDHIS